MAEEGYPHIVMSGTDPNLPQGMPDGFAKYSQIKPMAKGGRGELFSAWDNLLGRLVAVKTLKSELAADDRERRRFLREARVTAQLAHPNTVPVYEVGRDDKGGLYFTMKRLLGEDLSKILIRLQERHYLTQREFKLPRLIDIVVQASQALVYAHSHGVVHRDIKPENIWIGQFDEVLVLDWGVAKVWGQLDEVPTHSPEDYLKAEKEALAQQETSLQQHEALPETLDEHEDASQAADSPAEADLADDDDDDDQQMGISRLSTLTRSGTRPGTPLYMSPEQVAGHRYVDERTDIYSIGVVLYELLTLKLPFYGGTIQSTFEKILHDSPAPPSKRAPSRKIPPELDAIVMRTLEKESYNRYSRLEDFVNELRPFASQ